MNTPGYEQLAAVLQAAYDQAAKGKGAERHADSKPFHEQPMQTGSDLLGTDAGLAFQAIKKIREGSTFTEFDRFEREMLGAINYIAGMIIWRRRRPPKEPNLRPGCSVPEGILHHPDCYLMRRGKPTLAQIAARRQDAQTLQDIIDSEDVRMDNIARNGNDGAIYDDPWYGAPEWARFKAQDRDGEWFWYSHTPHTRDVSWKAMTGDKKHAHNSGINPNWRDTLIERTSG